MANDRGNPRCLTVGGSGGLVCVLLCPYFQTFWPSATLRFSLTLPSLQLSIWSNCRAFTCRSCFNIPLLWH